MKAVELNYQTRGEGEPLLILHGLYGSNSNWNQHARRLAERYRVILPDLRNHGRSPHSEVMTYPAMAEDLRALLDTLGLEQALVLGHSMGGKAAMTLALQQPERVRALIAADIAPVTYRHEHDQIISALQGLDLARVGSRADADAALRDDLPNPMVRQFLLTNLERRDDAYGWRIPLDVLARSLPAIEGWPEPEGEYRGPALFLHGAESDYVLAEYEPAIRRYFPAARVEALAGAGHWLHVEQPEAFAAALDRFLATL